jgi:Ca2+-binding EF-hand superfamily protein
LPAILVAWRKEAFCQGETFGLKAKFCARSIENNMTRKWGGKKGLPVARSLFLMLLLALLAFLSSVAGWASPMWNATLGSSNTLSRHLEQESGAEEIEEDDLTRLDLTCIVGIALVLIALTIGFEHFKEHLEESVPNDMVLILEKLFGELTVLGFLAMVVFFVHQSGTLGHISKAIGQEEHEMAEYVEYVHYTIFFIMVGFVVQVLVLVKEAAETENQWLEMDETCREHLDSSERNQSLTVEEEQALHDVHRKTWYTQFLPQLGNKRDERVEDKLIFQALRKEFLLERSADEPFQPVEMDRRLNDDFNFGRYLALAHTHILTHVVEVQHGTWFCFACGTVAFYTLALLVRQDLWILAWVWIVVGWAVYLFNIVFERHLVKLRNMFLPRHILAVMGHTPVAFRDELHQPQQVSSLVTHNSLLQSSTESTPLSTDFRSEQGESRQDLPFWCDFELSTFHRSFLQKLFVQGKPNRQQVFFWMDRSGPACYQFILQLNLIFTGVYAGLLFLVFVPSVLAVHDIWLLVLYLFLAVLPVIGITYNKKRLVATITHVCSVGCYRKPQLVSDVLREEKTFQVVRTFIVFYKLRCYAMDHPNSRVDKAKMRRSLAKLTPCEMAEIGKTFDALDTDANGSVTDDELREFLMRLGMPLVTSSIEQMVAVLDKNGDGKVTRDEFLHWYIESMREDRSMHERAIELFHLFDTNRNGEITIGDFKEKFDAMHMGFSVDEIGAIVNELDRDRNGSVSLHEFEYFLEKYYPKELLRYQKGGGTGIQLHRNAGQGHP